MTYAHKISEAKKQNILVPDILASGEAIVGVYGFFAITDDAEECFYVGKASNMAGRLLDSSGGHIYQYLKRNLTKLVPQLLADYLQKGYRIEVRILEQIDYHDTSFSKAAHRLALAELQKIVEYQEKGQCIRQYPEGTGQAAERYWSVHYSNGSAT